MLAESELLRGAEPPAERERTPTKGLSRQLKAESEILQILQSSLNSNNRCVYIGDLCPVADKKDYASIFLSQPLNGLV